MGDYVDRKRLKEAIQEDAINCLSCYNGEVINLVLTEIDEAPAADVRPVVRGRWENFRGKPRCSRCKAVWPEDYYDHNFCPNCGADMREGNSNEK